MRKLLFIIGVLVATTLLPALVQAQDDPSQAISDDQRTVPSRGPGQDYKSDSALPEPPEAPVPIWTLAEAQQHLDPRNDPNILICDRGGGNFRVQLVRPAPPNAPVRAGAADEVIEHVELINDGGKC